MKLRILPSLVALFVVLGLSACGDSADTNSATTTNDTREVKAKPDAVAPTLQQRVETGVDTLKQDTADAVEHVKQGAQEVSDEVVSETKAVVEMVKQAVTPTKPEGQTAYASCAGCHGVSGGGGVGPALKGSAADDLVAKLKAYRAGEQVGPMTVMMAPMAMSLTDEDIDVLVNYIVTF